MMIRRRNPMFRCLTSRAGLMAIALLATAAWQHVSAAPLAEDAPPVLLPLSDLAVPATTASRPAVDPDATVLAPSCTAEEAGSCARLAAICDRLAGAMRANGDGTRTCVIVLD